MKSPPAPLRGLLHPAAGPVLRVEVRGEVGVESGLAVVDTGASISAIDRELARRLALPSPGAATWHAITDAGGDHTSALRRGRLRLGIDPRLWELDLVEVPELAHALEGYTVCVLLGWDFLRLCRLTCDGPAGAFTLDLPAARPGRR